MNRKIGPNQLRNPVAVTGCLVFATLSLFIPTVHSQEFPPPKVRVGNVKLENVQERVQVTGDLRAISESKLASQEDGLVTTFSIREADRLEKGDVVAQLDDRALVLQLKQVESEVKESVALIAERETDLEKAKRDRDRFERLLKQSTATQQQLDDAISAVAAAEARLAQARQALETKQNQAELLRLRVSYMTVRAPFAGVVIERHTEVGEWIGRGDPIVTLISTEAIEAWLVIPERLAQQVADRIDTVNVRVASLDREMSSVSTRIIPSVDPRARTLNLIARLDANSPFLASGMSVSAWVPTGEKMDRITIPKDAVIRDQGSPFVFKAVPRAEGGFIALPSPVRILFELEDRVVVDGEAFHDGEQVVIEGNERLFPMIPIQVADSEP